MQVLSSHTTGERNTLICLKPLRENDLALVHTLHSYTEVDRYNTLGVPQSMYDTQIIFSSWMKAIEENARKMFLLEDLDGDFVGLIGITLGRPNYRNAEIWYKLIPEQWGKGYATTAVKKVLEICFEELKLHRVEAGCATGNTASMRVLEKNGFSREGLRKELLPIRGEWIDGYSYALLEKEWNVKIP